MLEVRNLSKLYKTKHGADVNALDGVSIQFPEKGMVFLLGKSGSGKSTLLNVCGGLDAPTGGEVIVKGRSSKDFSQSDFDSYRNTYVGFIFQEYNILNEFSVEDNIALALELQGKPKDKKAVAQLLEQVDLEGFAKRKPNTLSGGQKQRIAIARALVKSPEIIMADEPTGALDSNTGKQVFETLKKLSQDKLVLVVSHDREFAEQYGDRIIELQDGKVLSDVTKTQEQQKEISENIHTVGDVLCIKQGADLNEQDFHTIRDFLRGSNSDVIIAGNEKDVKAFKKVSRITEAGEKEVFRDTKEDAIETKTYKPEDSKFIRSKLPAKHAIRIGVSSLKSKPIRLFFTIVLCAVAFVLFGLLSTMSFYNSEATFKQTMLDSDHQLLRLKKQYRAKEVVYMNGNEEYDYETIYDALFSSKEVDELKKQYGPDTFGGINTDMSYNIRSTVAPYWIQRISTIAYLPKGNALRDRLIGTYPANKNEICISSYMADVLVNCKAYDEKGDVIDVATAEELIGKQMTINNITYKITGIMDSGQVSEKYDVLKSAEGDNNQLFYELQTELADGLHLVAFVSLDRLELLADENVPYSGDNLSWYRRIAVKMKDATGKYEFPDWSNTSYDLLSNLTAGQKIYYVNKEKKSLGDGEVLLSHNTFAQMVAEAYAEKANAANESGNWSKAEKLYSIVDICNQIQNGGVWKQNSETKKDELVKFTDAELQKKIKQVFDAVKKDGIKLTVGAKLFSDETQTVYGDLKEFTIVGVYVQKAMYDTDKMIVSDAVLNEWWEEQKNQVDYYSISTTNYKNEANALYHSIFVPYDHSEAQTQIFWDLYDNETYAEDDSRIRPAGLFVDKLTMIDEMVKSLSQVFLYVGLALAIFAALLLSNFISVSISQKKKEIGILRAVGARGLDVFKIFFSESFVIASICVVLATMATIFTCNILNTEVASGFGASLFVFGPVSFIVLIVIALITTIVATFLPVWNAAKKKPVDSIRAL